MSRGFSTENSQSLLTRGFLLTGLRIVPGQSSFLLLPKYISRSTAVGAILSPPGASSPGLPTSPTVETSTLLSPVSAPISISAALGPSARERSILYIGADEHLIRRLNELPGAQTCAAGGRATFAHWRIDPAALEDVLAAFNA